MHAGDTHAGRKVRPSPVSEPQRHTSQLHLRQSGSRNDSLRINELVAELLEFVKRLGSHLLHSSIDEMVFYCVIQTNQ